MSSLVPRSRFLQGSDGCGRGWLGGKRVAALVLLLVCLCERTGLAIGLDDLVRSLKVGGSVEGSAVFETDSDSQRQRPAAVIDLHARGDLHRLLRLYADVRAAFGGPPEHAAGIGLIDISDTFQDVSPEVEIEEAYIDVALPRVDLRAGKQKIAWGRLDVFQPTDVLNPRRFTDPFLMEENDAKVGVPAVRASYYPQILSRSLVEPEVSLVWVPVPVPVRFPLEDERWFPPAARVPLRRHLAAGALGEGVPAIDVAADFRAQNADPPQKLGHGGVGLRFTAFTGGVDWSVYYYDGPETAPSFDLTTSVALAGIDAPPPEEPGSLALVADVRLRPRFERIRMLGVDAAFQLGGATLRAEAAYGFDRLLPRPAEDLVTTGSIADAVEPRIGPIFAALLRGERVGVELGDLFVTRDTVAWGIGVDYPYRGWIPLLQLDQMYVLDNSTPLLVGDVETRLVGTLSRSFLSDDWLAEVSAVQTFRKSSTSAIFRLTRRIGDSLRVRLGYLAIAGSRRSLIGQYKKNDEVFVQVRYER